jgi:hypothetical protein
MSGSAGHLCRLPQDGDIISVGYFIAALAAALRIRCSRGSSTIDKLKTAKFLAYNIFIVTVQLSSLSGKQLVSDASVAPTATG